MKEHKISWNDEVDERALKLIRARNLDGDDTGLSKLLAELVMSAPLPTEPSKRAVKKSSLNKKTAFPSFGGLKGNGSSGAKFAG